MYPVLACPERSGWCVTFHCLGASGAAAMRRQVAAVRGGRRRSRVKAVGAQPGRSHAMSSACHVIIAIAIAGLALG